MRNKEELQRDYPMFVDFGKDWVNVVVDYEVETFTIDDVNNYGSNGMSGLSCFGNIMGDHRMIQIIYEAVLAYFENESPELLEGNEDE